MIYLDRYRHDLRGPNDRFLNTEKCDRANSRPVKVRRVVSGSQTYTAFEADSLLEHELDGSLSRPGHAY